ncbi:SCY1 protein kinase [Magnaporthiopsis poae ATCC 64411]|uniref:SCY1 protein kinase n=1 Tax=Magnaporthiopsis poae (strain ATCC 64411 / 73-15) TaxID=644358 RepID=A0A0C4DZL1_MAGP6|nr:SCY1 protein kinase [Magnaporthiopsis poae ATCC 64411]
MDFLKSAVASAIAKGPPFPYTFGDRVDLGQSIWTLYNGTRREDGSNCSIFSFDITTNKARLPLAKNSLKKLRTLRHPGVIKVLDTVETDTYIYIATERLVPLSWHVKRKSLSPETLKWGLYSVARTVKFINDEASSIHGNLTVSSIYTSESGEWKLGGFDVLSNIKDDDAVIYTYGSLVPDSARYAPPELAKSGWDAIKKGPHTAVDSFNFGTLIFEAFNGDYMGSDQAGQTKNVPPSMQASYKRLVNANPKARLSVGHLLEQGLRRGAFFDTPLIKLTDGVDNLGVMSETERDEFLGDLDQLTDDFPEDFFKMKVLPELLKSVEFGGGGPKAFAVVMKIAQKLSSDDFDAKITPVVIRLFSNPDRAIRVCLLDNLSHMIDRLSQKVVNDKIFPQLVTGFTDVAPVVREQTLKSILVIISKLSDRTINGELLRYLAKTANDEQPGIRTNTTICLGKIARNLGTSSRSKVLIAAFSRSLRDPFIHARNAALLALGVTSDCFTDEDCATKLVPAICPLLIDKEKLVRDQADKTLETYLHKIRKAAAAMPDTVLPPEKAPDGVARMSTPQPTESAAAGWAGWAISSFTNKLSAAAGEMQSQSGGSQGSSAPSRPGLAPTTSSASALHRQAVRSPSATPVPTSNTSGTGRSPGGGASPASVSEAFFPDAAADDDGFGADTWGDMDEDDGGDNSNSTRSVSGSTTLPAKKETAKAVPFGAADDAEPDFAGWLAAQASKKTAGIGGAKPLPKGLSKGSVGSKATAAAKKPPIKATKPAVAKKIDMKPKESADDDDGWGDGW